MSLLAPTILVLGVSPQTWLLVVLGVVAGLGVQIFEVSWTRPGPEPSGTTPA